MGEGGIKQWKIKSDEKMSSPLHPSLNLNLEILDHIYFRPLSNGFLFVRYALHVQWHPTTESTLHLPFHQVICMA